MKHLVFAVVTGALVSGAALAQQGLRPGDPDPYASRPGAPNPYATRGGDPNSYATKPGDPNAGRIQHDDRRSASKERSTGYAKDPHSEHLPYGTSGGARKH